MPLGASSQNSPEPGRAPLPPSSDPSKAPLGAEPASLQSQPPPPTYGASRVWTICFAVLTLEVGAFLIVFPWMDAWHLNHFPALVPALFEIWDDPYFRGALSGLGVVNLFISFAQILYLFGPSRKS
jgi:hypothetical protein